MDRQDELHKLLEKVRHAIGEIPEGVKADWDGTNHYEVTTPAGEQYWWLQVREALADPKVDTSATEDGQRLGHLLDLACASRNVLPTLLKRLDCLENALYTIAHNHAEHARLTDKKWGQVLGWAQDIAKGALDDNRLLFDKDHPLKNKQLVIAVDFDCTVIGGYPRIERTLPYAPEVLKALSNAGHKLILWTCRENDPKWIEKRYLDHAVEWYKDNDIPLIGVNETPIEEDFRHERCMRRKVHADMYIDDKNFPGGFPGWDVIGQLLLPAEQMEEILKKEE